MMGEDQRLDEWDAEEGRGYEEKSAKLMQGDSYANALRLRNLIDTSPPAESAREWLGLLRKAQQGFDSRHSGQIFNLIWQGRKSRGAVEKLAVFQLKSIRSTMSIGYSALAGFVDTFEQSRRPAFLFGDTAARCRLRMSAAKLGTSLDGDPALFFAVTAVEQAYASLQRIFAAVDAGTSATTRLSDWIRSSVVSDDPAACLREVESICRFNDGIWSEAEKWNATYLPSFFLRVADEVVFTYGGTDCEGAMSHPGVWPEIDGTPSDSGRPAEIGRSTPESGETGDEAPVQPVCEGAAAQAAGLFERLHKTSHWVSFRTLAEDAELWRKPDPPDDTIEKAIKRANSQYCRLEIPYTIELKNKRARLVCLVPDK